MTFVFFVSVCLFFMDIFIVRTNAVSVGVIRNVSMILYDVNSTIVYGNCQECLCIMNLKRNYSSFTCNDELRICQMYWKDQQSQSYSLVRNSSSQFYFLTFPIISTSTTTQSTSTTTTTGLSNRIFRYHAQTFLFSTSFYYFQVSISVFQFYQVLVFN